jgi:hypothetical protein
MHTIFSVMHREMTRSKCHFFCPFFFAYHVFRDAAGNDVEQVPPLIKARRLPLCLRRLGSRHGVEHVAAGEGLDRAEVLHSTGIPDFFFPFPKSEYPIVYSTESLYAHNDFCRMLAGKKQNSQKWAFYCLFSITSLCMMTFDNAGRDPFVSLSNLFILNQIKSPKDIIHSDFM